MHANEPEMAKDWEKKESVREKIRGIIKRELEATTTSAVPVDKKPDAFRKSTYKAIQVDDEDDSDELLGGIKDYRKKRTKLDKNESKKLSDKELKDYMLYIRKYKPGIWKHMKKNSDLKKMIRKFRLEHINESIKVRNGEIAMEGKWKVYDSHSGKTIKEVGSPRAATRLMNRLMSSGQYKEITTKWVGETVNEADDHELEMAHGQLERSMEYSQMILKKLQDGGYDELPGWVQSKLTKSMDYLQSVFNYYDGKDGLDEAGISMKMKPFSSSEAKQHINQDIKKMSKFLGKASQQSIKLMMNGVKGGKYTAMDISRGLKEGPVSRTHFGELGFLQQLWNKVRDGFRRYSKDRKLS